MDEAIVRQMSCLDDDDCFKFDESSESYSAAYPSLLTTSPSPNVNNIPIIDSSFQSSIIDEEDGKILIIKPDAKILSTTTNNPNISCGMITSSKITKTRKQYYSSSASSSSGIISFEKPNSQLSGNIKGDIINIKAKKEDYMAPYFGDSSTAGDLSYYAISSHGEDYEVLGFCEGNKRVSTVSTSRTPLQAQDHVVSERKRRERITQRFIALSALVPGLKKVLDHIY